MKKPPKKILISAVAAIALGAAATAFFILEKPFRYAGTLEATKVDLSASLGAAIDQVRVRDLPPVTILIPIYNAHEDLKVCLESLARNTTTAAMSSGLPN